jgi:hypothetical protein
MHVFPRENSIPREPEKATPRGTHFSPDETPFCDNAGSRPAADASFPPRILHSARPRKSMPPGIEVFPPEKHVFARAPRRDDAKHHFFPRGNCILRKLENTTSRECHFPPGNTPFRGRAPARRRGTSTFPPGKLHSARSRKSDLPRMPLFPREYSIPRARSGATTRNINFSPGQTAFCENSKKRPPADATFPPGILHSARTRKSDFAQTLLIHLPYAIFTQFAESHPGFRIRPRISLPYSNFDHFLEVITRKKRRKGAL